MVEEIELKEYIKGEIKKGKREFNIGLRSNTQIDNNIPHRIKFCIKEVK